MNRSSLFLLALVFIAFDAISEDVIDVAVFEEHYSLIRASYDNYACSEQSLAVDDTNQMLAEFIVLCKAFEEANAGIKIIPVPFPLHKRIKQTLMSGKIAISGMGMWNNEADDQNFYMSAPLIQNGEFVKALYYDAGNQTINQMLDKGKIEFNKLKAVTNINWATDLNGLECAGTNVYHADRYEVMFKMLSKDRMDITTHALTNNHDMQLVKNYRVLLPLKGYKIVFDRSLHFFISKNHPQGKLLFEALDKGLMQLRKNGFLSKVYQRLGIIQQQTKNWQVLNCEL